MSALWRPQPQLDPTKPQETSNHIRPNPTSTNPTPINHVRFETDFRALWRGSLRDPSFHAQSLTYVLRHVIYRETGINPEISVIIRAVYPYPNPTQTQPKHNPNPNQIKTQLKPNLNQTQIQPDPNLTQTQI